jgi:hypothetical protein
MDPVSELSQYCQKRRIDYPKSLNPTRYDGYPIAWEWTFVSHQLSDPYQKGLASTKKEAKKEAAAKMLMALKADMGEKLETPPPLEGSIKWTSLKPLPPWKQDYFDNQSTLLEYARDVMAIERAKNKESYKVIKILTELIEGEEQMNQNIRLHTMTLEEHLKTPGKIGFRREVPTQEEEKKE